MQTLAPTKKRHGYADLKKRNPDLYRAWRRYIAATVDPLDWGYLHANGKSKPRANNDHKNVINAWVTWQATRQGPRPKVARVLSLRRLEAHGTGDTTTYYTNNPHGRYAALLLDIDDKDGTAGDSGDVLDFLTNLFRGIYGQRSTFGNGHHGYLLVDRGQTPLTVFRTVCDDLEAALTVALTDHLFKSTIEVKAVPPLLNPDGTYKTCGSLAKFPRLPDDDAIADYLSRPTFTTADLREIIDMFTPSVAVVPTTQVNGEGTKGGVASVPAVLPEKAPSVAVVPTTQVNGEETKGRVALWHRLPEVRMGNASRDLVHVLRRNHTPEELLAYYDAKGLNTHSDDDGNRAELAAKQTAWQALNFEAEKLRSTKARPYDGNRLLPLVRKYVTEDVRQHVRETNRSAYTDDHLAVALYVVELAATRKHRNPRYQFTVGNEFIADMLDKVGVELEGTADAQRRKLSAVKRALVASGLAVWVDETYNHGVCKRMALGPLHPDHEKNLPFVASTAKPVNRARPKRSSDGPAEPQ